MDNDFAIVLPVAGLSSRFKGRPKWLVEVGPNNESLIEYSLNQALKAGFNKIVFIVGEHTESLFRYKFGDNYKGAKVLYTKQVYDVEKRDKPWGTNDAVCCAKEVIDCPFVFCNGDDIYGEEAFRIIYDHLNENGSEIAIGHELGSVLPFEGKVNRAIFKVSEDGFVEKIDETLGCGVERGKLEERGLNEKTLCSMTIYGLHPRVLDLLYEKLVNFKKEMELAGNKTCESMINTVLSELISEGKMKMKCKKTKDKWFGISNPGDEEAVREELLKIGNKSNSYVSKVKVNVLEQFSLMEKELDNDFDDLSYKVNGVPLRKKFLERITQLNQLLLIKKINPHFSLNLNRGDVNNVVGRRVRIGFFPMAGNPPHWAHLMTALDAIIDLKLDKIVFCSSGEDFRKEMLDVKTRYSMIRDVISLFSPFFAFSNIGEVSYLDDSLPMISEYAVFKFMKINQGSEMDIFYLAGSDHLNRKVFRDGGFQKDTVGILEENIWKSLLDHNSYMHNLKAVFISRKREEFEQNLAKIDSPKIEILRLNPTFSTSSTAIRNALYGSRLDEILVNLPYICYKKILTEGLFKE